MIWPPRLSRPRAHPGGGREHIRGARAPFSSSRVQMSGVVPQVAAMLGSPAPAGTAYIPGHGRLRPHWSRTPAALSLGGARLVRARDRGEETTDHDMGGSQVHCYVSGRGDLEVARRRGVHRRGSRLPVLHAVEQHREQAPRRETADRLDTAAASTTSKDRAHQPHARPTTCATCQGACDDGTSSRSSDLRAQLVTALVRLKRPGRRDRRQPAVIKAGALDIDAADKAARFIWLCDAFNVPLVFLQDVPGFIVGTEVEKQGSSGTARDALCGQRSHSSQGDRRPPQGIRRRVFRDVWSRATNDTLVACRPEYR